MKRIPSTGIRTAIGLMLSIVGVGSAVAQTVAGDHFGEPQQRERVIAELRQAKADGTVKRWSPTLIEISVGRRGASVSTEPSVVKDDPGSPAKSL